jgi:putative membrane protein
MQRDGTSANRRLMALAVEKGWPSPTLDMPDTKSDYSDHSYVARQIRAQQDAIALYKEEAANGADTDLQEFARDTLPTLQHSLVSLQSLQSS